MTFPDSSTLPLSFTQQVGWRTDNYLVIGQIVTTTAYNSYAPPPISFTSWGNTTATYEFRQAVLGDMTDILTAVSPLTTAAATNLTAAAPVSIDSLLSFLWAGFWGGVSHSLTPQGPFTSSALLGSGNVTDNERLWMTQDLLNDSIDTPPPPPTIDYGNLSILRNAKQFRLLQNYQVKFLVNDDGTFGSYSAIHNVGDPGTTKVLPLSIFPSSVLKYFNLNLSSYGIEINGNLSTYNCAQNVSTDGYSESGYASARIGPEGQNVTWRQWGTDAPWVYSEIISTLDDSDAVTTTVRTSADITWQNGTITSGSNPFNNLRIYIMEKPNISDSNYHFQMFTGGNLSMEGSLQYFLGTGSSTWGDTGIPPSF